MTQQLHYYYLSKGYRYAISKGRMHPNVYSSTINNRQSMERAQMHKEDVMHTHTHTHTHTQWNITLQSK